jgi:hypothetical protein
VAIIFETLSQRAQEMKGDRVAATSQADVKRSASPCVERERDDRLEPLAEIDCKHWLWPSYVAVDGVDVPHWIVDQEGENA